MAKRKRRRKETDKERILKHINYFLSFGKFDVHRHFAEVDTGVIGVQRVRVDYRGRPEPQWVSLSSGGELTLPPKGSIVMCGTNPFHPWGISRYHSGSGSDYNPKDPWVIQMIGDPDRLCTMRNERLDVLIGIRKEHLLEGLEYKTYNWAKKCTWERYGGDYFSTRFDDVEFLEGDVGKVMRLFTRPHIWQNPRLKRPIPRSFDIQINKNTRLKDIRAALEAQGWADKWQEDEFEFDPAQVEEEAKRVAKEHNRLVKEYDVNIRHAMRAVGEEK